MTKFINKTGHDNAAAICGGPAHLSWCSWTSKAQWQLYIPFSITLVAQTIITSITREAFVRSSFIWRHTNTSWWLCNSTQFVSTLRIIPPPLLTLSHPPTGDINLDTEISTSYNTHDVTESHPGSRDILCYRAVCSLWGKRSWRKNSFRVLSESREKRLWASSCLSIRLSARISAAPTWRIFVNFDTGEKNLSINSIKSGSN